MRLRQTTATPRPIIGDYGTDYSYRAGVAAVGLGAAGADFVVARDLRALVEGTNRLTDEPHLDVAQVEREVVARDREMDNPYTKDLQVTAIHGARRYAAGEVAGFGGGGMHGYRALEGTFLGGCLFSGRTAGRAVAEAVR